MGGDGRVDHIFHSELLLLKWSSQSHPCGAVVTKRQCGWERVDSYMELAADSTAFLSPVCLVAFWLQAVLDDRDSSPWMQQRFSRFYQCPWGGAF